MFSLRCLAVLSVLMFVLIASPVAATDPAHEGENDEEEKHTKTVSHFAEEPDHLWNRLYRVLYVRMGYQGEAYGSDVLDPLLWRDTTHLLEGSSHDEALRTLDEFLSRGGHTLIDDPLRRAVLQRDLWAVFDWLAHRSPPEYNQARQALRTRLARVIQRLSLGKDELERLPDTYAQAVGSGKFPAKYDPEHPERVFLPADLFQPEGPWVCIYDTPAAPSHVKHFSRSTFLVFIRLPGGRQAALDYFRRLNMFPNPLLLAENPFGHLVSGDRRTRIRSELFRVNPDLPQFPAGTRTALVRRMMLIDQMGDVVPTSLCESVQLRVYREVPEGIVISDRSLITKLHDAFEFSLSRQELFSGRAGGLRTVSVEAPTYSTFMSHGEADFQRPPRSRDCVTCHQGNGVHSFQSYIKFDFRQGLHGLRIPSIGAGQPRDIHWALESKRARFDWGLLRGLWESQLETEEERP